MNNLSPARQLAYDWLNLPYYLQIKVLNEIKLPYTRKEIIDQRSFDTVVFKRAKALNKIEELRKEIDKINS